MISYTVRIELKKQTEKMRIELLFIMLENGFSRSVVCSRGFSYALPTDEYVCVTTEEITDLMKRVVGLVSDFTEDPIVLVTRNADRCWTGLRVINLE